MKTSEPRPCKTCKADLPLSSSIYRLECPNCETRGTTKRPRTHRHVIERTCLECGVRFNSFRKDMRFCKSACRAAYSRKRRDVNGRYSIIEAHGAKCAVCGAVRKLIVRYHDDLAERVPLCPFHNSEQVRRVFYKRVPNPGPGYAKRIYLAKKLAKEAAEEAEVMLPSQAICKRSRLSSKLDTHA